MAETETVTGAGAQDGAPTSPAAVAAGQQPVDGAAGAEAAREDEEYLDEEEEVQEPGEPEEEDIPDHMPARPIKVGGRGYLVVDMGGAALSEWTALVMRKVRNERAGKAVDMEGFHAELICRCLRDRTGTKKIPKPVIKKWGAYALNRVFELCQQVNGLDGGSEDREGKG